MKIVTLATCYNRREKTLEALSDLYAQELPDSVTVEHIIVDDGSTDGTSRAVAEGFPEVEIVKGTGGLFWAGGMRYGWEQAVRGKTFDYLLVYNDDIRLKKSALSHLLMTSEQFVTDSDVSEHVVVGAFCSETNGETSYSGLVRSSWWHPLRFGKVDPPDEGYQRVNTLNMNAGLITRHALDKVGFLSEYFIHSSADYEYGLKMREAGGEVVLSAGYIGVCERNYEQDNFVESSSSLKNCYKMMTSLKRQPVRQRMRYFSRYGGFFWPLLWLSPYFTLPIKYGLKKFFR